MAGLRLEAVDFVDLTRWRWVLTDDSLGRSSPIMRCGWMPRAGSSRRSLTCRVPVLARRAGPAGAGRGADRRRGRRVDRVAGARAGRRRAGAGDARPPCGSSCRRRRRNCCARPLELAHVGGKPLAVQDVTLVMETGPIRATSARLASGCGCLGCSACPRAAGR